MPRASDSTAALIATEEAQAPVLSFAEVDADFARRMDLWGAYHRMAVASLTMAATFGILAQPDALLWVAAFYLGLAALVPSALGGGVGLSQELDPLGGDGHRRHGGVPVHLSLGRPHLAGGLHVRAHRERLDLIPSATSAAPLGSRC